MSVVGREVGAGDVARKRRGRRSRVEVEAELERFRASGLPVGEYARRSDVSEVTLRRWLARESGEDAAGGFAPVRLARPAVPGSAGLRLRVGAFDVQVGAETDPFWVAALLRALANPC